MNDIYQFSTEDVYRFKSSVGRKAKKVGDQLVFGFCPYCSGGANKDKDTFAISLITGQFECKRASCTAKGNMITLAKDFADRFDLGKDVAVYHNINGAADSFKRFKDAHREIEVREPAVKYLMSRGISEEVARKYEITTMPGKDNVLVFPFRDENGELTFVKYRDSEYTKEKGGNKEWSVAGNYKKILFGMNHCEDFGTLVITEGQIDSLSCASAGIKNAVSVPTGKKGFTWKPNVWNWLVKFDEIVVFGDHEHGEITLAREISSFFPKKVRIVRVADYQGCKDANELLQRCGAAALVHAVDNAEVQVSLRIKNLAEVESVDLDKITAYPTGIRKLDESIGRGFHEGELVILTGKCGEGKSTFASQIVAKMLKNGLKCFCYSGELPAYMFKAWLDKQIYGGKVPTEAAQNGLNDWYDKKCFIYDNSTLVDDNKNGELDTVMTQAVRDLGCKFILIDNLMTAMEDKPSEDLFRAQSAFVGHLTKFAKGFNVTILLVAHPKKGDDNSNDSISGSGDITNRANTVLRYQRAGKTRENTKSKILITKNRTTGVLDMEGIEVEYDPESMRITEVGQEQENYLVKAEEEFVDTEFDEEIPF